MKTIFNFCTILIILYACNVQKVGGQNEDLSLFNHYSDMVLSDNLLTTINFQSDNKLGIIPKSNQNSFRLNEDEEGINTAIQKAHSSITAFNGYYNNNHKLDYGLTSYLKSSSKLAPTSRETGKIIGRFFLGALAGGAAGGIAVLLTEDPDTPEPETKHPEYWIIGGAIGGAILFVIAW